MGVKRLVHDNVNFSNIGGRCKLDLTLVATRLVCLKLVALRNCPVTQELNALGGMRIGLRTERLFDTLAFSHGRISIKQYSL